MPSCLSRHRPRLFAVAVTLTVLIAILAARAEPVLAILPDPVLGQLSSWMTADAAVQLEWGRRSRASARLDDAEAAFATAAELLPADPNAKAQLALVLVDRGEFARASAVILRAVELAPDHPNVGVFQARRELGLSGPAAALRRLQPLLTTHPDSAEGWYVQAQAFYQIHNTRAALESVSRAIQLEPKVAAYRRERAQILQSVGSLNAAETEAASAHRLAPADPLAQLVLGRVLLDRNPDGGKLDRAARLLEFASRNAASYPERQLALRELGRAELLRANWQAAIALLEQAATIDTADTSALYYLAHAYRAIGDPRYGEMLARFRRTEAVQREERYLRAAVKEAPRSLPPRQRLRRFYLKLGRVNDAESVVADVPRFASNPPVVVSGNELPTTHSRADNPKWPR